MSPRRGARGGEGEGVGVSAPVGTKVHTPHMYNVFGWTYY